MSTKYFRSRQPREDHDSSSSNIPSDSSVSASMRGSPSPHQCDGVGGDYGDCASASQGGATGSVSSLAAMMTATQVHLKHPHHQTADADTSSVASSNLTDDEHGGGLTISVDSPATGKVHTGFPGMRADAGVLGRGGDLLPSVPETAAAAAFVNEYYIPSQTNPKQVEDLLRLEHMQLNEDEQKDRDDEVHGYLSRAVPETPELLMESLRAMQRAVLELPNRHRKTYNRIAAASQNPAAFPNPFNVGSADYFQFEQQKLTNNMFAYALYNQDLWLKILRADRFDVQKAALRYCRYLDLLHKYWGDAALMRPLYLSDFNKDDLRLFKTGRFQVLFGARDRSGRRLFSIVEPLGKGYDISCRIKVMLYVFTVASDDIVTQRDGGVALLLNFEEGETDMFMMNAELQKATADMVAGLPLRFSGMHMCLVDSPIAHVVKSVQIMTSGKEIRKNQRVHIGSQLETLYKLQHIYGIPVKDVPLTSTGSIKVLQWKLWIKARTAMDDERKARQMRGELFSNSTDFFRGVECPDFRCILFRKAGMAWDHPPNKVFRSILASKQGEKLNAKKLNAKIQVITDILDETRNLGFKFMTWDDGKKGSGGPWYVEITDMFYLRECVAQAMRDSIKREKTRTNVQIQDSKGKESIFEAQDGKKRKIVHDGDASGCGGCFCSM